MTNKEKYISSFSGVEPSDEIKERILNMASTKKRYSFKALAVVLAVLIMVAAAMLTANAVTDGAVGEKIIEFSKEIEKISVVVNGKVIEATFKYKPLTDENGKTSILEIVIPESLPENLPENKQGEDEIVFELNEVTEDVGKIVVQKSEESTETDNVKVIVESE